MPRHIRKGDSVIVTKGASKGTIGEIIRVIDEGARVVVKGVNIRTMHIKPTQKVPQGSILKEEGPINASNVSPVVDGKPSRVRFVSKPDGSKSRIAAWNCGCKRDKRRRQDHQASCEEEVRSRK
jgi:large subunit ribosomal protein L24